MKLAALASIPLLLADGPPAEISGTWIGAWKLDRARSQFTAPLLAIGRVANGYHFDFGAVSFDIGDDGRDYPTVPSRTTSLKVVGEKHWMRVHKVNGQEVDRSQITISPDGQELLIDTTSVVPGGKTRRTTDRELRIGSGQGLAGVWRTTSLGLNVSEEITLSTEPGGRIRRSFPGEGQSYSVTPGGPAAPYTGPRAVPGVTVALTIVSGREMRWTEFINAKPYTCGVDTLSADGRSMTETTWPITHPGERQAATYIKR